MQIMQVTHFLNGGEDPNVLDGEGWTGLHKAAFAGHAECVTILLTYSANVNAETSSEFNRYSTFSICIILSSNLQ